MYGLSMPVLLQKKRKKVQGGESYKGREIGPEIFRERRSSHFSLPLKPPPLQAVSHITLMMGRDYVTSQQEP